MYGQDVQCWSYDRNFIEGRQSGTLGINAEHDKRYSADLFLSGSGNTPFGQTDRDNLGLTLSAKF